MQPCQQSAGQQGGGHGEHQLWSWLLTCLEMLHKPEMVRPSRVVKAWTQRRPWERCHGLKDESAMHRT